MKAILLFVLVGLILFSGCSENISSFGNDSDSPCDGMKVPNARLFKAEVQVQTYYSEWLPPWTSYFLVFDSNDWGNEFISKESNNFSGGKSTFRYSCYLGDRAKENQYYVYCNRTEDYSKLCHGPEVSRQINLEDGTIGQVEERCIFTTWNIKDAKTVPITDPNILDLFNRKGIRLNNVLMEYVDFELVESSCG